MNLRLDWCSYEAAKFAVEHWHYSHSMPAAAVKIGVWEDEKFIGVVLFGRGAAMNIASPYGLQQTECVELLRVALNNHKSQTSKIVSVAISLLKRQSPGLKLLVSYADTKQGHEGIIYQAMNWVYVGDSLAKRQLINGKLVHPKTVYSKYGRQDIEFLRTHIDKNAQWVDELPKRKYLFPLNDEMRKQIEPLRKPYPKRQTGGRGESDSASQSNEKTGGASPTRPLLDTVMEQ